MLNVILGILMVSFVGASGLLMVKQLELETAIRDQNENARRLETAAEAVGAKLGGVAGREGVFAPMGELASSTGINWYHLPASIGGVNKTVAGIPFRYCPVGPAPGQVKAGDYDMTVEGGRIIGSNLDYSAVSAFNPAAFLIAAGRSATTPPECGSIKMGEKGPVVDGGLVRVVARPFGANTAGTFRGTSSLTIKTDDDLDMALTRWVQSRPEAMTISLDGNVRPSDAAWGSFRQAFARSNGRLTIEGSGSLGLPSSIVVAGILDLKGSVGIQVPGGSAIEVLSGGRLAMANGSVARLSAPGGVGVSSSGDMTIVGAMITAAGAARTIDLNPGSRLDARSAAIGSGDERPTDTGIYANGASAIVSDGATRVFGANGFQPCWASADDPRDLAFRHSANGLGAVSSVAGDVVFTPTEEMTEEERQQGFAQAAAVNAERRLARSVNRSVMVCS